MLSKIPTVRAAAAACSVVAAAIFLALTGPTPAVADDIEGHLNGLHHRCERGDQHACVEFGRALEANRERHEEWRHRHPEYWGERPPVRVVETVTPETLHRLHRACEHGDHAACRDFRYLLESNREHHEEWRRTHPEFWIWLKN